MLAENHQTFARCSSLTDEALKRYGLIQRECEDEKEVYKDFLVYKKDYRLSELDKDFITQLIKEAVENFMNNPIDSSYISESFVVTVSNYMGKHYISVCPRIDFSK